MPASSLTPMLTVKDASAAIQFYGRAFGAVERTRFTTPTGQVVAELAIDGLRFYVVDENPEAFNVSPVSVGGTTVRMNLVVDDPDATASRALRAGGIDCTGTNNPHRPIIGYRMAAPIGCAKRDVGTMLAIRKPIDRILHVLIRSAIVNPNTGK